MSVDLQPLADYIVAEGEAPEARTASGLYLPGNAQEKPMTAKVLAIGEAVRQVKVGDRIIYKGFGFTEVKMGSKEYILVKEDDVLATVKEK